MKNDPAKQRMGPVRTVPLLAAQQQARQMEAEALKAHIAEHGRLQALVGSDAWAGLADILRNRDRAAVDKLVNEAGQVELARLQGEIRVYRYLLRQPEAIAMAIAQCQERLTALEAKPK